MRPSRTKWYTAQWMLPGLVGLGCSAALVDADRTTPAARPGLMPPGVSNTVPASPPLTVSPPSTTTPTTAAPTAERSNSDSLPHVPLDSVFRPKGVDEARYHEVKSGDTLTAIARRHGTTVRAIEQANGLDSKVSLTPGQMLFIPK